MKNVKKEYLEEYVYIIKKKKWPANRNGKVKYPGSVTFLLRLENKTLIRDGSNEELEN